MSGRRSNTVCAVGKRPDHHCGDDPVVLSKECSDQFNFYFICMSGFNIAADSDGKGPPVL